MFRKKLTVVGQRPGLYLNTVMDKGRGLFCADDIKAGEVLEVTPVMVFPEKDTPLLAATLLRDYCFSAAALPEAHLARFGIADPSKAIALIMGMASYCNHLSVPNAETQFKVEGLTTLCSLIAVKDIPKDHEICINYGIAWFGSRKLIKETAVKSDTSTPTAD